MDVWQEPTQHCNAMFLQLKINKKLKKKPNTDGLFGVISPQGTAPAPTMETAGAVGGCWETDFFVLFFFTLDKAYNALLLLTIQI